MCKKISETLVSGFRQMSTHMLGLSTLRALLAPPTGFHSHNLYFHPTTFQPLQNPVPARLSLPSTSPNPSRESRPFHSGNNRHTRQKHL